LADIPVGAFDRDYKRRYAPRRLKAAAGAAGAALFGDRTAAPPEIGRLHRPQGGTAAGGARDVFCEAAER